MDKDIRTTWFEMPVSVQISKFDMIMIAAIAPVIALTLLILFAIFFSLFFCLLYVFGLCFLFFCFFVILP